MLNKNVLITGASGFLGTYIKRSFKEKGYDVYTLGRRIQEDIKDHSVWDSSEIPNLKDLNYTKVIHIAGKAHSIPKSKEEIQDFYNVNLEGTKKMLQGLHRLKRTPSTFIFVSSVAVYGIKKGLNIKESFELKPITPYGDSKLKAECLIEEWCKKNACKYYIFRLPLIVGNSPPGNLGAMKKAILNGTYPRIKGNKALKSVVLAQDIAAFFEAVEGDSGIYNLTDGIHPTFEEIENAIARRLNTKIKISIPKPIIKVFAVIGDFLQSTTKKDMPISSLRLEKIIADLTFDDTKARRKLKWTPDPALPFIEKYL